MLHISQIAGERVENVGDYLTEGQDIRVKVLDVDQRGRIKLSLKEAQAEEGNAGNAAPEAPEAAQEEAAAPSDEVKAD